MRTYMWATSTAQISQSYLSIYSTISMCRSSVGARSPAVITICTFYICRYRITVTNAHLHVGDVDGVSLSSISIYIFAYIYM